MQLLSSTPIMTALEIIEEAHGTSQVAPGSRDLFRSLFGAAEIGEPEKFFPPAEAAYFREWIKSEVEKTNSATRVALQSIATIARTSGRP